MSHPEAEIDKLEALLAALPAEAATKPTLEYPL